MLNNIDALNHFRTLWSDLTYGTFALQDIEGFPYDLYAEQLSVYEEAERWVKGLALNDQPESPGSQVDLYPMRINPLIGTVLKHAYSLFGETEDDGRPLVWPKFIPRNEGQKALAKEAEETLNYLWWENNGRAIQLENGILSQIYGGCVLKATYVPWEDQKVSGGWRTIPIRIERINPKGFIGYPDSGDMYRLNEAWIVREVPRIEAQKWGYTGDDLSAWMVDHWLRDRVEVFINNKPATFQGNELGGENPFGIVPIVYIPHVRMGDFYGVNAIDHLKGMVKELNLRFADYGDAVNDDAHSYAAMRNVQGSPQIRPIAEGLKVIDLGSSPNISGQEPEPDLFEIRKQRAGAAMKDLVDQIIAQYRRDSFVPAVADGEDEGSQRSALTLATRFWPLTSHVGIERIFWGAGLDVFHSYVLKMMATKNISGITEAHTQMRIKEKWANMLPRDREVDVQEWVQRVSANLGSIEHLLELTGDIEDVQEERALILKWIADLEDVKAKVANKYAIQQEEVAQEGQLKVANVQAETFAKQRAQQQSGGSNGGGAK